MHRILSIFTALLLLPVSAVRLAPWSPCTAGQFPARASVREVVGEGARESDEGGNLLSASNAVAREQFAYDARGLVAGPAHLPAAIGHLGEGAGTFAGDPGWDTAPGLFMDIGVAASVLATTASALPSLNGSIGAGAAPRAAQAGVANGGTHALKCSDTVADGMRISPYRVTGVGEKYIRYESANPAYSKITPVGGVKPGTFAAPMSDGLIPISRRASTYNLPNPEILRPSSKILMPPPGTPIIGPRPVSGGSGSEVIFWMGY